MIKAVIFDLGGVLIFYNHMIAARKMSRLIRFPKEKIFAFLNENKEFNVSYELKSSPKIYWGIAEKELGKKIPISDFEKFWNTIFWPNKKMILFARKIKKKYKIALLSNTGNLHGSYLSKKYHLQEIFSVIIYSYKVKTRKPNRKIYEIALKKLHVKPREAIFIDDKKPNVKGAEKVGIHGVLFRNSKQAIRDVDKIIERENKNQNSIVSFSR